MDSRHAVQGSQPTQRPGLAPTLSGSDGDRPTRKTSAVSNPLLQSKYATDPQSKEALKEGYDNDHVLGHRFSEVASTMGEHDNQLNPPEDRHTEEPEQVIEREDNTEPIKEVEGTSATTMDPEHNATLTQDDQQTLEPAPVTETSEVDANDSPLPSATENTNVMEESVQEQFPQQAQTIAQPNATQDVSSIPTEESITGQIVPIRSIPSPRPSIKVPWGKKTVTIRIPHDPMRGKEGGPPAPLHPGEVAARIAHFEVQGYDTRGFVSWESADEYSPEAGSKQNRPIFPDPDTVRSDGEQLGHVVRIPDPKAWQAYVEFVTEQKLRALGVSLGDEEPPLPPPRLSRQSSVAQYPPLPFSPPVPPSSGNSQQMPQLPTTFSTASVPEPLSATMSRKASIASPLSAMTANNSRAPLQRQSSFPFGIQPHGNVPPFSSFSPQQQLVSPLTAPRAGSPATQHTFANRAVSANSPGPSLLDMQQLTRYPPALQAELAQMQRQQQQQLQAKLQQQHQLALNTKLPDFADDGLAEEPASAHPPLMTGMVDHDQQEIAVPRPRSHRHNLSAALEKDIPNAEYHLKKQIDRQMGNDSTLANLQKQTPWTSAQSSDASWNEAAPSLQVLSQSRQTRWTTADSDEQRIVNSENRMAASASGQNLNDELKTNASAVNTNLNADRGSDTVDHGAREKQIRPAPLKHTSKPSISGLNVGAKEFKFNPNASFQPGSFSFSGANFQLPQPIKTQQPNYSRPLPQPEVGKNSFKISAPAFNPVRSFGNGRSSQSFNFSAPSFKPGATEFKPSATIEESTSGSEQPSGDRIFTSIPTDTSTEIVKQPRKNKAVQIINPNLLPKAAQPQEQEDESGRLVRDDDRQKRARRADDDGDQVPQFAFPAPLDVDFDTTPVQPGPVLPSTNSGDKFEEVWLGEERIPTPVAAAAVKETSTPVPMNAPPTIDELRQRAIDSISKPQESATAMIEPTTATEEPRQMSPAQAALHAVLGGKRHGHKSSLSAAAKPFEFKPLSSDNDFPSFSGKTSEIIDSQNDSSQILSSPTQPLESSIATTFRPGDSFFEQTASESRKQPQPEAAPYPMAENEVNYDDFVQPSLAEIDDVMRQFNENDDLGVEKEEPPSWEPSSPPFQAEQPLLKPRHNLRSDAPSPSPSRARPTIETGNLEDETASHDPFSDSHAAVVDQSPIRRLNNERDVPISDWDDAFSSSDEEKLKAQVQSRSIFFEPHVEKVVAKAFQSKMDPMMTTLLQLQDSMLALAAKGTVERRSVSASAGAESDADDEDDVDDEEQRPPRSRSRGKAFPTPELLNPERIKSVVLEALQVYNTPPTPPAPGVNEFHEALISLKSAVARSDAEKMQLEDIRAIMEETLDRRDSALVPHSRNPVPYPEDDGQVMQLDRMLQDATVRAAEAVNQRNEIEDRAAETRKLLRLAEEEVSLYKELVSDKDNSIRSVRDELSDLREHLHDVQEHRVGAEKEHQNLTAKISSLEEELAVMESTLEEYRELKQVWRQEIDDLSEQRANLKSNVVALTAQVNDGIDRREEMRDRLARLQEDMARSAEQMASAKARWHQQDLAHQTRAELLTVRIGDEARTRERLEKEIQRLETQEKEHMNLRVLVDHTQNENTRLEDMVTTIKKELFEQQQLAARFERDFKDARDTARVEIHRTKTSMEADVDAANQQVNLVRADLEAENTRMRAELEVENERLRTELDNIKMEADTTKEKHALLMEEAADAKRDTINELQKSHSKAMDDLHQSHERFNTELQANHRRAIGNAHEDKERSENFLNERLGLSDAKLAHYHDKVVHLEQKLEVAQSAAQAAIKAAQSAKAVPQAPQVAPAAAPTAAVSSSTAPVPEKISPQALRESIMVLQEQLQERESRIEYLESELKATDTDAPTKLKERDTEISWLRELLGVRIDDLGDLVNLLSQPAYDPDTVRDAAIRIRANLQMEQQEKERLIAAKVAPGQTVPVTVAGQQALASISNFASPKAAQLAAAFGNWRKGNQQMPGSNLGRSTPLRPSSNASTQGWMTGLMTPPTSNLRKTPSPSERTASPEKPRTPQRQTAGPLSGSRHPSLSPQTSRRHNLTARQLAKQPTYAGGPTATTHPVTPPLLRQASYDNDAEDGEYSTAGFEGFGDDEEEAGYDGDDRAMHMAMGQRISPEPPRLQLDFGAPIGDQDGQEME